MPLLNAIASKPDERDYKFLARLAPLPETDLRPFNRDIEDQGQQGSCTLNAATNAIELMTQRAGQWEDLSRQFGYYTVRDASGLLGQEGAYSLRDVLESLRKTGICLESEWPYGGERENVRPPESAYMSALLHKVFRYEAIDISKSMIFGDNPQLGIDNINSALAEGMPVLVTANVGRQLPLQVGPLADQHYTPVDYTAAPGTGNAALGVHSFVLDGNSNALGAWIKEGSWGTALGDGGYFKVPYACIRDFSEAWIIRGYKDISFTDPLRYAQQMRLVKMYVAVLGRAPELGGFKYWLDVLLNGRDTLAGIAQGMMLDTESRARFKTNGEIVCDMIDTDTLFANRVEVAAYCVLDLACDKLNVAKAALDIVTADPASVPLAKFRIRQMITGGVL